LEFKAKLCTAKQSFALNSNEPVKIGLTVYYNESLTEIFSSFIIQKNMLLVNVGIMLGAYIGVRLFEHHHQKPLFHENRDKKPLEKFDKIESSHQQIIAKDNSNLQLVKSDRFPDNTRVTKESDYLMIVSSAAMGLSILGVFYPPLTILSLGAIIYCAIPMFKEAEYSLLKEKRIKNDTPSSILTIMTVALGQAFAGAIQVFIYHLANRLVNKSQDTSTKILTKLFHQQATMVWVLKDQVEIEIPLKELEINDIVVVSAGEVIPIDGTIIDGMAMIDQHALTGEAVPVEKEIGDQVFAATLMISGKIQIKVEKAGFDTTVSQLCEILNHTTSFQTQLQLKGQQWSDNVATPLLGISALSSLFLGLNAGTAVLFSAPINSIRVFTSLHTFNHLTLILQQGILIKDGRALEELTQVDTILFDKTGTLTKEQPAIGLIIPCDGLAEEEILTYAACAERKLTHPIARAILKQAEQRQLSLPEIEDANYKLGYGVTVNMNTQEIKVGSARFMKLEGISIPSNIQEVVTRSQQEGSSFIMVAINQQLKGTIEIRPQVRPEVKNMLSGLRQRGIKKMFIVSGDHEQPTQKLAKELGMDDYFYEVVPTDKAALVEQLQKQGHHVCFVGDGINDAIAMKQANVSISLKGATSIATDMAQVVFMDGSLSRLCDIFELSKKLDTRLRESLIYCSVYGVANLVRAPIVGLINTAITYWLFFGFGMGHTMLPLISYEKSDKRFQS
jgi:heavy metal translocating P-type ATPase